MREQRAACRGTNLPPRMGVPNGWYGHTRHASVPEREEPARGGVTSGIWTRCSRTWRGAIRVRSSRSTTGWRAPVYGLIRKVLKDPAQSEEVAQEVLLEVWRNASRFDPAKGGGITWVMMIAHRRAIDRVRSASAEAQRDQKSAIAEAAISPDEVAEAVEANLDRERVRRCLHSLTDLQRESITLAYYGGYTYRQSAPACFTVRYLGTIQDWDPGRRKRSGCATAWGWARKLLRNDLHTLSGAYALDALDDTERERFEQHQQRCEDCLVREVRDLRETATRLALAVAPRLRRRSSGNVSWMRPPGQRRIRPSPSSARRRRRVRPGMRGRPGGRGFRAWPAWRRRPPWSSRWCWASRWWSPRGASLPCVAQEPGHRGDVLNAPDARIVTNRATVGGRATVVYSHASKKLIITTAEPRRRCPRARSPTRTLAAWRRRSRPPGPRASLPAPAAMAARLRCSRPAWWPGTRRA